MITIGYMPTLAWQALSVVTNIKCNGMVICKAIDNGYLSSVGIFNDMVTHTQQR